METILKLKVSRMFRSCRSNKNIIDIIERPVSKSQHRQLMDVFSQKPFPSIISDQHSLLASRMKKNNENKKKKSKNKKKKKPRSRSTKILDFNSSSSMGLNYKGLYSSSSSDDEDEGEGEILKDRFLAVVKRSRDPYSDFRKSMVEMIMENHMFGSEDLENLLYCFLSLNSSDHHRIIVHVFCEICEALFSNSS